MRELRRHQNQDSELAVLEFRIGRLYTPKQTAFETEVDEGYISIDNPNYEAVSKIRKGSGENRA